MENTIIVGNYELPQTQLIENRLRNVLRSSYHSSHDYTSVEKDFREIELHTANKLKVYCLALDLHKEVERVTIYPRMKEIAKFLEDRVAVLSQYKSVKDAIK
jgi:hypothetical protein